ncbi:MAG: hypothetical protein KBT46_03985, partial [Ruminococcus sp.]|nr:hypothetical protein [Candidatus Copronaster equi]
FFNYLLPTCLFLILLCFVTKKERTIVTVFLSALCGLLTEQVSVMTVTLLMYLIIEKRITEKKWYGKLIISIILAVAGSLTVLFSGGVGNRISHEGGSSAARIPLRLVTIIQKEWLSNSLIFVLISALGITCALLLFRYSKKDKKFFKLNKILGILTAISTLLSWGSKFVAFVIAKVFVDMLPIANKVALVCWAVYALVLISMLLYTSILALTIDKNHLLLISVVLAFESQAMMSISDYSYLRTCLPGFFMFMVYVVFVFSQLYGKIVNTYKKKNKVIINFAMTFIFIVTCLFQSVVGVNFIRTQEHEKLFKLNEKEMNEFTDGLTEQYNQWTDENGPTKYNLLDFSNLYDVPI